jgi:hypothetical protein
VGAEFMQCGIINRLNNRFNLFYPSLVAMCLGLDLQTAIKLCRLVRGESGKGKLIDAHRRSLPTKPACNWLTPEPGPRSPGPDSPAQSQFRPVTRYLISIFVSQFRGGRAGTSLLFSLKQRASFPLFASR